MVIKQEKNENGIEQAQSAGADTTFPMAIAIESKDKSTDAEPDPTERFLIFGEPPRQPLGSRTNAAEAQVTAEEQLRVAQERMAVEKARVAAANAADKAAADKAAANAKAAEAAAAAEASAAVAKERAEQMWQAKVVFAKDMPDPPLPAFDFEDASFVGKLVLIPAKKYPKHATIDAAGQENFMGWAGKVMGYESKNTKVKVKVHGDAGYEHLTVKGTGPYALPNLMRLI